MTHTSLTEDAVEDYLAMKKLHSGLGSISFGDEKAKWDVMDCEALGAVRLTLANNIANTFINMKTTKDLMETLAKRYEALTANNKVHLKTQLFNMKMKV